MRGGGGRRWWQAGVEVSTHTCKLSFANEADSIAVLALCTGQASVFSHLSHLWLGEGAQWHEDLRCMGAGGWRVGWWAFNVASLDWPTL